MVQCLIMISSDHPCFALLNKSWFNKEISEYDNGCPSSSKFAHGFLDLQSLHILFLEDRLYELSMVSLDDDQYRFCP